MAVWTAFSAATSTVFGMMKTPPAGSRSTSYFTAQSCCPDKGGDFRGVRQNRVISPDVTSTPTPHTVRAKRTAPGLSLAPEGLNYAEDQVLWTSGGKTGLGTTLKSLLIQGRTPGVPSL